MIIHLVNHWSHNGEKTPKSNKVHKIKGRRIESIEFRYIIEIYEHPPKPRRKIALGNHHSICK
jgi:hypothetical protein